MTTKRRQETSSATFIERKDEWFPFQTNVYHREIRLVLLGKTGSGKSATGNTILGSKRFKSRFSGTSITRYCSQANTHRFNHKIVIVDTPGIFDTEVSNATIQEEIYKCVGISSPGPHAFILVLNVTARFTEEEERSVNHFVQNFGEDAYKYFIVLFTRKDDLDDNNITLQDHINHSPERLQKFIWKCGGRMIAFNNKCNEAEENEQVKKLLYTVLQNVKENGGDYYTNDMYIKAEAEIKRKEAEQLRKKNEIREKNFQKRLAEETEKIKTLEKNEIEKQKKIEALEEQIRIEKQKQKEEEETEVRDSSRESIEQNGSSWCTIS